ncbi:hypothetical protein SAMN05216556_10650 [Aequorivita viscosa]|uniref:Uncharacterized protein n=1 Tax=Aequorivita viscosa TaxID=797419 RepID=A0A1M6DW45_9FLAO|nr:hypothetical protein SAMN05216556_10650 [Aequorivita viscosa]SHI77441.1 hypothetical protein SAMN04487908_105122 [Aequorivita viscosa]
MRLLLAEDDIYSFVISISEGRMNTESIIKWIKSHTTKKD